VRILTAWAADAQCHACLIRRVDNKQQLPGWQEGGEVCERAFEAWLREAAILPIPAPAAAPAASAAAASGTDAGMAGAQVQRPLSQGPLECS
jgi:hypothetical protein